MCFRRDGRVGSGSIEAARTKSQEPKPRRLVGSLGRGRLAQVGLAGCVLDGLGPCAATRWRLWARPGGVYTCEVLLLIHVIWEPSREICFGQKEDRVLVMTAQGSRSIQRKKRSIVLFHRVAGGFGKAITSIGSCAWELIHMSTGKIFASCVLEHVLEARLFFHKVSCTKNLGVIGY